MFNTRSLTLSTILTLIFDLLITSRSTLPYRFIFDLAFLSLSLLFIEIVKRIYGAQELDENILRINGKYVLYATVPVNIITVYLLSSTIDCIYYFDSNNTLSIALKVLPNLALYFLALFCNSIIVKSYLNKLTELNIHDIITYMLLVLSIISSISIYSYQLFGSYGIRLGLIVLYALLTVLAIRLINNKQDIYISYESSEKYLIILSFAMLLFYFTPFCLFSFYTDNSISLSGLINLLFSDDLKPFYISSNYYTPITSYVSAHYLYSTFNNNILLSSTAPYILSYVLLPFVVYRFMSNFITEDKRLAILGVVCLLFFDGLAVLYIPRFHESLSKYIILEFISPRAMALKFSMIRQFWLQPYKNLSLISIMAFFNYFKNRSDRCLFLGGSFLVLILINFRQIYVFALITLFLYAIDSIKVREFFTLMIASLIYLGSLVYVIFYKFILTLNKHIFSYLITESFTSGLEAIFFGYNGYVSIIILTVSFLVMFYTERSNVIRWENLPITVFVQPAKNFSSELGGDETDKEFSKYHDIFFYSTIYLIILYLIVVAYDVNPSITRFVNSHYLLDGLVDLIIRYHVLVPLALLGVSVIMGKRFDPLRWFALFFLVLLTGFLRSTIDSPVFDGTVVMIFLSLVALKKYLIKNARIKLLLSLTLIFAGCASSLLLTSTVQSVFLDPCDEDLPYVLDHVTGEGLQRIYSPDYSYHVSRIVRISLNTYSPKDESDFIIIDRDFTSHLLVQKYLENESLNLLYEGDRFILFKR